MASTTESSLSRPSRPAAQPFLVPWDPDNIAHVERLFAQRKACGWNAWSVEKWRGLQREGEMSMHWIAISPNDPDHDIKLARHTAAYPDQAAPLTDTATTIGGIGRTAPSVGMTFTPIGHISLDRSRPYPMPSHLTLRPPKTYWMTSLYISDALAGSGLGGASMDAVERMAVEPPFNALEMAVDCLDKAQVSEPWKWEKLGQKMPERFPQDWYLRRGYAVIGHLKSAYTDNGVVEFDAVVMSKRLVGQ